MARPSDPEVRPGLLSLVSTPIGNLDDLSPRAISTLAEADIVACEDTRHSGRLLARLALKKRLLSLHDHNEASRTEQILSELDRGQRVAVISDAGTPLISDPGYPLVRACVDRGHTVQAIPGPSAVMAALVVSGLPPYPFSFVGFPPPKRGKRQTFFKRFAELEHTLVLFESPHRLLACLDDAVDVLGDRRASVSRELTKLHEETLHGRLLALRQRLGDRPGLKGEFVIVIGRDDSDSSEASP